MSLVSNLNLSPNKKPTVRNPVVSRRQSLLNGIDNQIDICERMLNGETTVVNELTGRQKPKWFWLDESGTYLLSIKYGKVPIDLEKNKFSIVCLDLETVLKSLISVRETVKKGTFDNILEKMSKDIRSNFKR